MANTNTYFQLEMKEDGVYLRLIPGEKNQKPDFNELDEYIRSKRIEYDKNAVIKAVSAFTAFCCIKIAAGKRPEESESMKVVVSEDFRTATARFYPASVGGKPMNRDDIIAQLGRAGVRFGVEPAMLDDFLKNRQYCQNYVLAKAVPPVEGRSAVIEYHFNTDLSRKPKMSDDGSVDYHNLDNISHVKAGDCLATLTPAVQGKPGMDVLGRAIKPADVKMLALRAEKNVELSQDGLRLISKVNGHANLVEGTVFVSNTFEVPNNVDATTGDISYDGNVEIKGNVLTGFKVFATGDIVVDGVVEGAELTAGGQIVLKRGIQGMGRGTLKAASNIITKFIENAKVKAGGYVATDAILHSAVTAKGEIVASGKRGFIVGGEIRSAAGISVQTAGSAMGTTTLLEIGADPKIMEKYNALNAQIPELEAELNKVNQIFALLGKKIKSGEKLDQEKTKLFISARDSKAKLEKDIQNILLQLDNLQQEAGSVTNGYVQAHNVMYPGCKVILYSVPYFVRSELKYARLIKDRAEVKLVEYC